MTKEELLEVLPYWQERLRLQDWDILIKFEKHCECLGNVRMKAIYKHAGIVIREPEFIDPDELGNKDLEVTLVHELLHVQAGRLTEFLARGENDRWYDEMERVVELTAIALVTLRRAAA